MADTSGRSNRSLGRRIFLSLLPLIPLFVLIEVILSTLDYPLFVGVPKSSVYPEPVRRRSPWGDWRLVMEHVYLGSRTVSEYPYYCRAFIPPRMPPPGMNHLVFIGDSVLFGAGLPEYETMPFHLSAYLRYYGARPVTEMVNLGIAGADTLTYARISPLAIRYNPSLVVLSFTMSNDSELKPTFLDRVLPPLRSLKAPPQDTIPIPPLVKPAPRESHRPRIWNVLRDARDAVLAHSRTLSALYMLVRPFESRARQDLYMQRTFGDRKKWGAASGNLAMTIDFFRRRRIPVVVIIYPHVFATHGAGLNDLGQYRYEKYHRLVRSFLRSQDVPVIDLLDYFRAEKVRSLDPYSIDGDGHPNGDYNALVARHLARDLMGPLGFFKSREAASHPPADSPSP